VKFKNWILIVLMAIPAMVGMVQLIKWIFPAGPKVIMYYDQQEIGLPKNFNNLLSKIYDLGSKKRQNIKFELSISEDDKKQIPSIEELNKALKLALTQKYPSFIFKPECLKLLILNKGLTPAKNLKITFPREGYIEIDEKGKPLIGKETLGQEILTEVNPNVPVKIIYWGSIPLGPFGEIAASHDTGQVKLMEGDIENAYIVSLFKPNWQSYLRQYSFIFNIAVLAFMIYLFILLKKGKNIKGE